jgi:hypothetical protein
VASTWGQPWARQQAIGIRHIQDFVEEPDYSLDTCPLPVPLIETHRCRIADASE